MFRCMPTSKCCKLNHKAGSRTLVYHHCNLCLAATGAADPFAIRSGGAPQGSPVSPPTAGGAEPVRPVGDINDWFRKLCQSSSGVLYEDNYLQV